MRNSQLTEEELKKLETYKEYAYKQGTSCLPVDKEKASEGIRELYSYIGQKEPEIIFLRSPSEALEAINKKKFGEDRSKYTFVSTYFWGQQDYYWIAFYTFAQNTLGVKYDDKAAKFLKSWEKIADSCGWLWPYSEYCFVSDRPEILAFDERKRLHKDGGPAVQYRDGYKQWYLHGVPVPQELAETPKESLDPALLPTFKNTEVRLQFIKKIGVSRIKSMGILVDAVANTQTLIEGKGKTNADMSNVYELVDMKAIFDGRFDYAPYLFMINPSTGEIHSEGVHPDCKTVKEALNWRTYGDKDKTWDPIVLT